ncbi:MAG: DUF1566 domain-containing protein [Gammaproteobacteria bacterium]|nr:DUF1566 domain-containing protein [Gammaproteobacteria bacterium]
MLNKKHLLLSLVIALNLLLAGCDNAPAVKDASVGGSEIENENGRVSSASAVALPKTGQTLCFDAGNVVMACTDTGQDGEYQAGVAWPSPRFIVDSSGNCITDTLTNLMWARNNSQDGNTFIGTWSDSLTMANNLDLCGFGDWRMPNRKELLSLVNYGASNTGVDLMNNGFNILLGFYWSSSRVVDSSAEAWVLILINGVMSPRSMFESSNRFIPVRAAQ